MQFKKLTSVAVAAVVLTSSLALTTGVKAENYKLDFLTAPFEIMGDSLPEKDDLNRYVMTYLGKGYYDLYGSWSGNDDIVVRITEDDLKKWRETGEFTYTKINYDGLRIARISGDSFDNFDKWVDFDKGDYFSVHDDDYQYYSIYKLDETSNSIVKQRTFSLQESNYVEGANRRIIRPDGYSVRYTREDGTLNVTVIAPDETEKNNSLTCGFPVNTMDIKLVLEGKYICYAFIKSGEKQGLYGIDKEGNIDLISALSIPDTGDMYSWYGNMTVFDNFIYFNGHEIEGETKQSYFYDIENDKLYDTKLYNYNYVGNNCFSDKMYSGKVIASIGYSYNSYCYIHDLVNDKIFADTALGDDVFPDPTKYARISTNDGEIYHLSKKNCFISDGYGYFANVNGTEKFIEIFSDYIHSSDFIGDYAIVTVAEAEKKVSTYLIDREFNRVSEKIDGWGAQLFGDGLFDILPDGHSGTSGQRLATYYDVTSAPVTEPTPTEPTPTEPTETDTPVTNPPITNPPVTEPSFVPPETTTTHSEVDFTEINNESNEVKIQFANGVISQGTVLEVKKGTITNTSVTFDISLKLNNKVVQPNGTVTVKIKIPDNLTGDKFYVYRIETDGSYTDMNAEYSDGYITFKTSHFSEYIISTLPLAENAEIVTTTAVVTETTTTAPDITTNIETTPAEATTINTSNADNTNDESNLPTGNVIAVIIPIIAFASGITAVISYNKKKK